MTHRNWKFFHDNAGCIVGQKAICAASLARAEEYAQAQGWTFEWEGDYVDDGPRDWGWSTADVARWERSEHEQQVCILRNAAGLVLGSLCGIWDASREYMRVVEAELASEAMAEDIARNSAVEFWEAA
jgi:hypothetical protein